MNMVCLMEVQFDGSDSHNTPSIQDITLSQCPDPPRGQADQRPSLAGCVNHTKKGDLPRVDRVPDRRVLGHLTGRAAHLVSPSPRVLVTAFF